MEKSKFTYPKCPWCNKEYDLMELATRGWKKETNVKCHNCGMKFKVRVHITYYGLKIKE